MKPCKEWGGHRNEKGYGVIDMGGRNGNPRVRLYAHRHEWLDVNGPIPDGMCVMHTCDNPACYEISHLKLGTRAENNADMCAKGRANTAAAHAANRKLSDRDVMDIRANYALCRVSQAELSNRYEVNSSTISRIVRRETRT